MRCTGFCLKLKKIDCVSLLNSCPIACDAILGGAGDVLGRSLLEDGARGAPGAGGPRSAVARAREGR
jgi:hypothetical protein